MSFKRQMEQIIFRHPPAPRSPKTDVRRLQTSKCRMVILGYVRHSVKFVIERKVMSILLLGNGREGRVGYHDIICIWFPIYTNDDDLSIFPFLQSTEIPPDQRPAVYTGIFCTYLEKTSCNSPSASHCSLDFQLSNTVRELTPKSFIVHSLRLWFPTSL